MRKISKHSGSNSILIRTIAVIICLLISSVLSSKKNEYTLNIKPTKWKNNKSAAVSITFDDGYSCQFTKGISLLSERHFFGTFFLITGNVNKNVGGVNWDIVRKAALLGHEIGSHTVHHADLTKLINNVRGLDSLRKEVVNSQLTINQQVCTQKCLSFCYPWNKGDIRIENIISNYYICACTSGSYENDVNNLYEINRVTIKSKSKLSEMNKWVDNVINENGWLVECIHGIDSGGWQPVPYNVYDQHFSYLKEKESFLWVATVQDIVKYTKERQSFMIYDEIVTNKNITFYLTDFLPDDIYNYPLTITMNLPAKFETVYQAKQNNRPLPNKIIFSGTNRILLIDGIIPNGGKVIISLKKAMT